MNHSLQPASLPDGSALCLSCGFCCRGVLHLHAALEAEEIPLAQALGLEIAPHFDVQGFRLPCPRFRDGKCSTYELRPQVCPRYKCQLLHRYLQGQTTQDAALALVCEGEERLAAVEANLGPPAAGKPLWQQLELWCLNARRPQADEVQSAESLRQIVRLAAHLQQHFARRHMANPMYAYVYWTVVSQMVPRETLEALVGKAVINAEFRQALHADAGRALAGYGLSQEAQIYLKAALDAAALDSVATSSAVLATLGQTLAARSGMQALEPSAA